MQTELFDKPLINLPVSGIYAIINRKQNRLYVGSSIDVVKRTRSHLSYLRRNKHHCKHLQNAWNKYGESEFSCVLVEEVDVSYLPIELRPIRLFSIEQKYLDELFSEKVLYNSAKVAGVYKKFGLDIDKQVKEILYTANEIATQNYISKILLKRPTKEIREKVCQENTLTFKDARYRVKTLISKRQLVEQNQSGIKETQAISSELVRMVAFSGIGISVIITVIALLFHFGFCCK